MSPARFFYTVVRHRNRSVASLMRSTEIQEVASRSVLCWFATVDGAGQPNVAPKEIFAVFDSEHLVVANIASPASARNVEQNPRACVSFVDVFAQRGFNVTGVARNVKQKDADYTKSGPCHS